MNSPHIAIAIRGLVFARANGRCEYCQTGEKMGFARHQLDHIIAIKHGGESSEGNLALSCMLCNRHKGADISSIDTESGMISSLFNPRIDIWNDHFLIDQGYLVGLTPAGRATIQLLRLNESTRIGERNEQ